MSDLPDYDKLLKKKSSYAAKKILGFLLKEGKPLRPFKQEIVKKLNVCSKNTIHHHLNFLELYNFIESAHPPIKLKYKTPLCWLANTPRVSFAYLGLLGERRYPVSETETAIELLKSDPNVGAKPEKIVVLTSQEVIGEWKDGISPEIKITWETLSEEELNDIDKVEEFIKPKIIELMKNYILIMDLTSGPRTAGLAYYELADQFKIPLIYVYYPKKRLRWLISKEKLMKEVGGVFYIESEEKGERGPLTTRIRKRGEIY
ncbi:MAG: hypothetical protein QW175_04460 [Candidatus Bathyarchaeia archaeon]